MNVTTNRVDRNSPSRSWTVAIAVMYTLLFVGVVVLFVAPFLWLVLTAFKPRQEIFSSMQTLGWNFFIPTSPTFENFTRLFRDHAFHIPLVNSLFVMVLTVVLSTAISSMMAYVLAWLDIPGKRLLFLAIISTLLFTFETKIVPLYLITQRLQIDNTYFSIIIPWLADAYFIFLLRQHFLLFPRATVDAALIDGCSYLRIYWNVMLPNIRAGLVSAAFVKAVFSWDAFMWPLIAVTDPRKTVITVAISRLFSDEYVLWELVLAGSFVATVPLIILFLFLQKSYIEGFVQSGIKG